ncbi:phosphatidylglycerol lysyltransferase domain-containing protein [Catenuloplanes japonicus]|uniref:phosphatidylglycerol lysyltransferase domain-containing protein n=1 Tax=Catenuloplanes japonicus TaxID=33876 RepID=UPI00068C9E7D|nr:phosphatidylglycerol lysyltransferase domain-containing protein [Catenuloplanes japonicus]
MSQPDTDTRTSWQTRPPRRRALVARVVQFAGLFDMWAAFAKPRHGRTMVLEFMPTAGLLTARVSMLVGGALLIYLGAGLRRGNQRAWQVAMTVVGLGFLLQVGRTPGAALVSIALCALLVAARHEFRSPSGRTGRVRAFAVGAGFLATGFALGFLEIATRHHRLAPGSGPADWAVHAALGVFGVTGPVRFASPFAAHMVDWTTGAFGLLAAGTTIVLLLRPGTRCPDRTVTDEAGLHALLARHGGKDSLSYFALRHDKSLLWAANGSAVIAYRVINGVSLASGDPIGPESAWPDAIGAWLADCAAHGWTPAVLGCGNAAGKAFRKHGLDVVELGDEAVLDVGGFSLQGRPMRGVRQAVNRMQRAGYTCSVDRQRDLPAAVLADAVLAADRLRDGAVERGFSMALSRIGEPGDGECLLVICRDAEARIRGVLQFVPWGDDGLSLDLMRGDREAGNGLTELMVVAAVEAAPAFGVRRVSLNFAVLRSVFARADELGAGPVLRMWHRLLRLASRAWQIESLYRANAKYQPEWHPRYLCFPTARDLPRIAVGVLSAESFLPHPRRSALVPLPAPSRTPATADH